jgi:F-type H+-transporting ATPase subunit epsilon
MLTLEIVTPDGVAIVESDVEAVVLRRREKRFEIGSEVAVLPGHAPMLVRLPIAPARYIKDGSTAFVALCGGFAEVFTDRVVVLTPRCWRAAAAERDTLASAWDVCEQWRTEEAGSHEEIVGMPQRARDAASATSSA